mgnify:FL=1
MSKRIRVWIGLVAIAIALLCLLVYSLERTAWLFELFEESPERATAAAVVVELAAVALIAGAGALDDKSKPWASRALLAILSVQALGNLSAGYLKGGVATLEKFGSNNSAYVVAATLWLVANLAVPWLVFCLSKLMEQLIVLLGTLPKDAKQAPSRASFGAMRPALAHSKPENTVSAAVVADGECKYCHQTGLTAIERARHGKAYKAKGVC